MRLLSSKELASQRRDIQPPPEREVRSKARREVGWKLGDPAAFLRRRFRRLQVLRAGTGCEGPHVGRQAAAHVGIELAVRRSRMKAAQRRGIERRALALLFCAGCNSTYPAADSRGRSQTAASPEVTRLRLLLSNNPVDPGAAFRCHAACQQQQTPNGYLECLSACPGFEQTPGMACAPNEVPPLAACFTAQPAPVGAEPSKGSVVVAVLAGVPLVVGVSAVCASQTEPCSYAGAGLVP